MSRRQALSAAAQSRYRLEQLLTGTERDTEFLEVRVGQFRQDLSIDLGLLERLFVALQPQLAQPSRSIHNVPHGENAVKLTTVTSRRPTVRSRRLRVGLSQHRSMRRHH